MLFTSSIWRHRCAAILNSRCIPGMFTQLPGISPNRSNHPHKSKSCYNNNHFMHNRNQKFCCCLWLSLIPYGCQTCLFQARGWMPVLLLYISEITNPDGCKPEMHDERVLSGSFSNEIMQMIQTGNICKLNDDLYLLGIFHVAFHLSL